MDLTGVGEASDTKQIKFRKNPDYESSVKVLVPSSPMEFPVKEIDFTGIGYIDGMLHIQAAIKNPADYGYFFLTDKAGNEIHCDYYYTFRDSETSGEPVSYNEYVFKIPKSGMDQHSLYGTFVTGGSFTKGNWCVTFRLEPPENE